MNRIIQMAMRIVIAKLMHSGTNWAIGAFANRKKAKREAEGIPMTQEEQVELARSSKESEKRMKDAMRMTRRIKRF
ncbi:MAG: hypothetical protein ACPGVK_06715 [Halocynthiibacter sp.]